MNNTLYTGPIVDGHIHLWNSRTTPRVVTPLVKALGWSPRALEWLVPKVFPQSALRFVGSTQYTLGNYLPTHWQSDAASEVLGFVHMEASWKGRTALASADETKWLASICDARLLAIVGHADLSHRELNAVLDAHQRYSAKFVGVRDKLAFSTNRSVMSWCKGLNVIDGTEWRRGYDELGRRNLSFDAWCYGHQLRSLEKLFAAHPGTRVVLDHLGTPIGAGGRYPGVVDTEQERLATFARWKEDLARIAEHKQVHAKLSGLTMPVLGFDFHRRELPPSVDEIVEKLGPFIDHALKTFSPARCFFASNFPMDKVSLPWSTLFAAFAQLTASYGMETQRKLFADNARGFYKPHSK